MIDCQAASLIYLDHGREVFACREVSLELGEGEFLGILGPSGSGKSSLLYLLSGLKLSTRGAVLYRGKDLAKMGDEERAGVRIGDFGFIFQQPFLLGYLTARENVIIGGGANGSGRGGRADELLEALGLGDKARRLPHELSGGERQRVCVARALLGSPKVVFADEPTASLDHTNGVQVVQMLDRHRGSGSLVMVTHDPTMLERADRILRIVDGSLELA